MALIGLPWALGENGRRTCQRIWRAATKEIVVMLSLPLCDELIRFYSLYSTYSRYSLQFWLLLPLAREQLTWCGTAGGWTNGQFRVHHVASLWLWKQWPQVCCLSHFRLSAFFRPKWAIKSCRKLLPKAISVVASLCVALKDPRCALFLNSLQLVVFCFSFFLLCFACIFQSGGIVYRIFLVFPHQPPIPG